MASRLDVPSPGLGTYRNDDHEQCRKTVLTALETGYRHIDTAEAYGNERAVGEAIAASDVPRGEVFLATKVLHPKFADGYGYDDVVEAVHGCLDRLDVDSVDLLYGVHWPAGDYDPVETFAACADLRDDGLADHIGACNLTPELLHEAREASDVPIRALQVEMHPLLRQSELRAYCERRGVTPVAYAPLGYGAVFDDPDVRDIAAKHDVSEAQVSLAWLREKGVAAIPKATGADHLRDNLESRDLALDDEDVARIDAFDGRNRQYDPGYAPEW